MVEIKSNITRILKPIEESFAHLSIPSNYEELMPSKVRSFESTDDGATLDIEGIGKVELAITDRTASTNIVMKPQNKVPFKFDLQWHLNSISDSETEVYAQINADLNFMMKMMAEKL
ncbi:MAG: SRPBCC family protein, partial [Bacteroidia bacterium]